MSKADEMNLPSVPTPPPPPTFPTLQKESKLSPLNLNTRSVTKVDETDLEVAINRLLPSERNVSLFYKSNSSVVPQLQDGPKCGLVALSIATSAGEKFVKTDSIFENAVSLGLTKQGEMFSADSLALLAEGCGFKTRVINGGLNTHLSCIIRSLLRKCFLLVPYDADFNHAPCCKRGRKAHWAVITGFVILKERNAEGNQQTDNFIKINSQGLAQCNCSSSDANSPLTILTQEGAIILGKDHQKTPHSDVEEGKLYLIGLQGKSLHVGLWLFDDMARSNNNLYFYATDQRSDSYIVPEGGLEEGLKGKAVILDCCLV